MSFVNRQLYKQKPQAWGPVPRVQASIFKNAEKVGIDPGSIALCMPMWGPGDQISYGVRLLRGTSTDIVYSNGRLYFNGTSSKIEFPSDLHIGSAMTMLYKFNMSSGFIGDTAILDKWWDGSKREFYVWFGASSSADEIKISLGTTSGALQADLVSTGDTFNPAYTDYTAGVRWSTTSGEVDIFKNGVFRKSLGSGINQIPAENNALVTIGKYGAGTRYYRGDLSYLYWFKDALTDPQIAHLSDNPYYLLHRVAPVFCSVPGGGVLPTFNPLFLNAAQPTRVIQ